MSNLQLQPDDRHGADPAQCKSRLFWHATIVIGCNVQVISWFFDKSHSHWLQNTLPYQISKHIYFRGHSTTTWIEFCHFLTPPPAWTVFIPWAWTKTDIFWPHPTTHLVHVVIEYPLGNLVSPKSWRRIVIHQCNF